jgi:hypothetical protein
MSKKKIQVVPTKSELSNPSLSTAADSSPLVFGRSNYQYMLLGLFLVVLGLVLMSGGAMPDENTWDPTLIYSWRRITLAPIFIIVGLGIEIFAIFKKN